MRPRRADMRIWIGFLVAIAIIGTACTADPFPAEPETPALTVFGPWRGAAADQFREAIEPFEQRTGLDVQYTGSGSFAPDIVDRVGDGDPPDVAIFPQPGLMNELAQRGSVLPLPSDIAELAQSTYLPNVSEFVRAHGRFDGVLYRLNVKSLVWYPPAVFAAQDYQIPETWGDLERLADRMVDDGFAPWCFGVEAFEASGWPATDWIEDIVLRFEGTETYDSWVRGETPFTADAISNAFQVFGAMTLSPNRTGGGRSGVLNTAATSAQDPMFDDPPECLMHRQATFQIENLPPGVTVGADSDTDVFILPGVDSSAATPLLVGGTAAAALTDREETWELMRYLATPEAGDAWAEAGGFISPHTGYGPDKYGNDFDAQAAEFLSTANVVRFDGSDLMDPSVGERSFLDAMLLYIGTLELDEALLLAQSGYD